MFGIDRNSSWIKRQEKQFAAESKAATLLILIAAEFKTDPSSTACFDSRIVKQVIDVADELLEQGG